MNQKTFEIQKKYLFFPIGVNEPLVKVFLSRGGEAMYDLDLRLSENPDFYTWLDTETLKGKNLTLSSDCDAALLDRIRERDELPDDVYREKLRPRVHYTPMRGWVNDPNGLVWHEGKYHLFYQHNPYDIRWGNMHWGHAESPDLIHWHEVGEALYPDGDGTMFSGSAVVDKENVTGLGKGNEPALLLFYTAAGGSNSASEGKKYTVCMAYSLDNGKTFVKFAGNPVLDNLVYGNRDPKVFWHEKSGRWCMILFMYEYKFAFFSSEDLLHWTFESEGAFPTMNECPEVFELADTGKWVILAGADYWGDQSVGKYYIGSFDGREFVKEDGPYPIDFGKSFYSLQTFENDPKGRRILMGWRTCNFHMPNKNGMPFNGEFSIPTEIRPCTIDSKLRIARYPVEEFFRARTEGRSEFTLRNVDAVKIDRLVFEDECPVVTVEFEAEIADNAIVEFDMGGVSVYYHSETQTLQSFGNNIKIPLEDGKLSVLLIRDTMSLELYVQGGKYPVCGYAEFTKDENTVTAYRGTLKHMRICSRHLKSIWEK